MHAIEGQVEKVESRLVLPAGTKMVQTEGGRWREAEDGEEAHWELAFPLDLFTVDEDTRITLAPAGGPR